MKLGFGFYRHQLNDAHFNFARQCGCTHAVVHLVDYFKGNLPIDSDDQPVGTDSGWGLAGDPHHIWSIEELRGLREKVESHGLKLEALENFDPAHWYDVLLDGPRKEEQLENIKLMIQNAGEAGVPIIGYNFSIAGVAGRKRGPVARGNAEAVYMDEPFDSPMPKGMAWNMIYDQKATPGLEPAATHEQLWARLSTFLQEVLPVAEKFGVKLAAHPDDPPMPTIRQQPRLIYQPDLYQKLFSISDSSSNVAELCVGTIAEMSEGDVYETVNRLSRDDRIGYVHLRNVRGKVPNYQEAFIDDGDVNISKILSILKDNNYKGVIIPDHTPQMNCQAPWHAGMAFACGYIRALMQS